MQPRQLINYCTTSFNADSIKKKKESKISRSHGNFSDHNSLIFFTKKTNNHKSITNDNMTTHNRSRFSFIDLLRILGGILFLNAFLSWWFTSTSTWGYKGKLLDTNYLMFKAFGNPVNLTISELSRYDGTNKRFPIYVAINGQVFDVSASPSVYGPSGPYHGVAGKDAARVFVTGCFRKPDEFTYDLRGLDEEEVSRDLKSWQEFFMNHKKYWHVGVVQHEEIKGDPPEPCQHVKFPGMHS